jgi:hypothetical protein
MLDSMPRRRDVDKAEYSRMPVQKAKLVSRGIAADLGELESLFKSSLEYPLTRDPSMTGIVASVASIE